MDGTRTLIRGAVLRSQSTGGLKPGTMRRVAVFARPYWSSLGWFLLLTMVSAVITVSTPLLAGRVVDAIVGRREVSSVVFLAVLIAALAVADAGFGLVERWLSARIGEGLIFSLRRAVFEHVQRMPVAFFTRTRTGALVSRLNNDVIGAQRAFTSTLSGLVSNVISLALSLAVMFTLSWQV
ncbi:MAG: ABC transporter transmembrane domain-containing protein, partial [Sciscionella sp.]